MTPKIEGQMSRKHKRRATESVIKRAKVFPLLGKGDLSITTPHSFLPASNTLNSLLRYAMNRLTTAFALLPAAFATPFLQRTQTVNVVLRVNKVTSDAAIDVWNESKSEVLAQACSRSLTSGSFESSPILFTVDEYGAGTLSIGTQTYTIHDDPDVSGGIICGRIASPSELVVSCNVSIPESLQLRGLSKRNIQGCFAGSPVELFEVMRGLENPANHTTWTSPPPFNAQNTTPLVVTDSAIDKRQGACGV